MKQHGAFSWLDLVTTDVEDAKRFYTKLFGWTTEEVPMGGMSYTVVKVGGEDVGGIMAMPPQAKGAPPHWGVYVTVDDADATAKLAVQMGARIIVPPKDIPDVGRFCLFQDPQGAFLSVITYLRP
jgi:predicted enzyme related to lactoylglutathione lyase